MSPPFPRYRSLSTSTVDSEKDREEAWQEEEEAYHALVAEGGRPSHPIALRWNVKDNPNKYQQYKDIVWFWHGVGEGYDWLYHKQLMEWRRFREIQDEKRRYYVPRNRLQEYQDAIRESQEDAGCTWDLRVLQDRHQQTRLEDWNEFRALYYRKLKASERRISPAEQDLLIYQRKFEDAQAQARLTDAITDTRIIYSRFDDIRTFEKEAAEAQARVESAETALQVANRNETAERVALIRVAQQELDSAKDNLRYASGSEELRRLRDGYELHITRESMLRSKAGLNGVKRSIERWKVILQWIDDQYPIIAAECGYLSRGGNDIQAPGETEHSQRQRVWPPRRQRRTQAGTILGANTPSRVSKSSKCKTRSLRPRPPVTTSTRHPLDNVLQEIVTSIPVTPAQQGINDHRVNRKSKISRRLTKPPLQATRRSARIAERDRLQKAGMSSKSKVLDR